MAADGRFRIGEAVPGLTWVSACSGHGFKHSAALGEALAEWVLQGRSAIDLTESVYLTPHSSWPDALLLMASDKPRWTEPLPRWWRAGLLGNVRLSWLIWQRDGGGGRHA
jgi:hypothetical protein